MNETENNMVQSEPNHVQPVGTPQGEGVESKKKSKLPLIIVAIIVIAAILFGVYKFIYNNPKNVFLGAINSEYKRMENFLDSLNSNDMNMDSTVSTAMTMDFNINVQDGLLEEEELAIINELNALNFGLNAQVDYKNKLLSYAMNINHNENSMLNFGVYGESKNLYIELKNIFDKYIKIPSVEGYDEIFESQEAQTEDVKYVMASVKDSFLNNLNQKDFKETKEKITIGTDTVSAKKISYAFNQQNVSQLISDMLKELKEDDKFIKSLSNISGETEENIKNGIDDLISEMKDSDEEDSEAFMTISVYTTGIQNTPVQYSMVVSDEYENLEIAYSNYKGVKRVKFLNDNQEILTMENEKTAENTYETELTMGTVKLEVNSVKKQNGWSHAYELTEKESTLKISGDATSNSTEVEKDKEYKNSAKFTASVGVTGMNDLVTIEINGDAVSKVGEDVTLPKFDNSIEYTELTEEDMNAIAANIMNNQILIDFINKFAPQPSDDSTMYDEAYEF